jgi:23S rRNA-/tRNA-specific pseudouridylate synthase
MSDRLELYATDLHINHPQTDKPLHFIAPCPHLDA